MHGNRAVGGDPGGVRVHPAARRGGRRRHHVRRSNVHVEPGLRAPTDQSRRTCAFVRGATRRRSLSTRDRVDSLLRGQPERGLYRNLRSWSAFLRADSEHVRQSAAMLVLPRQHLRRQRELLLDHRRPRPSLRELGALIAKPPKITLAPRLPPLGPALASTLKSVTRVLSFR